MKTRTRYGIPLLLAAAALFATAGDAAAQDLNIGLPVDSIEFLLTSAPFEVADSLRGNRFPEDRTKVGTFTFDSLTGFIVKVAPAPRGGAAFNNVPAYEVAAYQVQKLFLDQPEMVVPPTVMRVMPVDWYRQYDEDARATFGGTNSIVFALQSWLNFVTGDVVWDEDRFDADPAYARHWANLNLFTYLIRHSDSNTGNVLISSMGEPRVFSVDNGVAFNTMDSDRGTTWRNLRVTRFPASTVARLRTITEEQLHETLGVLAQWEIRDEELVPVPRTENINSREGVRQRSGIVQIGLTRDDIDDVWYRLGNFLSGIDSGMYQAF
jgi:hypothetical protein